MTKNYYLCIHNHFYQPPRENPWLEAIEAQESATPFHDWNERISFESYQPNGLSRILDDQGWVVRLTNNYARTSFNFGPTLLSWMEDHDPVAYQAILDGDRQSLKRFDGHGSAIAQAYNHLIFPLASRRDKETQIKWGLRDFERRFGRDAEAMWLPETAADLETLEILAEHGMKYVILAPRQADAVCSVGGESKTCRDVKGEKIDPKQPYQIALPGGKSIAGFFYDGPISKAVAFEGLLHNGEAFANRLMDGFNKGVDQPQLLHIATDGESYGHHHKKGDMALAYALYHIEKNKMATIINYGAYLEKFPPQNEATIFEDSSWSCTHGVERWKSDCGCNSGMKPGWHQQWRAPLRSAFDWLRDELEKPYESYMSTYVTDPWAMRDDYIQIVLDRSPRVRKSFFGKWLKNPADISKPGLEQNLLKALEVQRNLLLVYTSCAWFFDEVSGLETVQNLQYAARVIDLTREVFGIDVTPKFSKLLESVPTNIPEFHNGRKIYERFALPARVTFEKIAAHIATVSLFHDKPSDSSLYCYDYVWKDFKRIFAGKSQMICANVLIRSRITQEERHLEFAVIHMGDHNINVGVGLFADAESYQTMVDDFAKSFGRGDLPKSVRLLDTYFGNSLYYLKDLFADQQKFVLDIVFSQTLDNVNEEVATMYEQHYPLMCYLSDIQVSLPPVLSQIAYVFQNNKIKAELDKEKISVPEILRHLAESLAWNVYLDAEHIRQRYIKALLRCLSELEIEPHNIELLSQFLSLLDIKDKLPFEVDLGLIQNHFSAWGRDNIDKMITEDTDWKNAVDRISNILRIRFDPKAET